MAKVTAISFTVPGKPVSTNATYRRGKGRGLYKTPEAVAFFAKIRVQAHNAMLRRTPMTGSVQAAITFVFDSERPDIDGAIKPVLDAMQGIAYGNDRQIRRLIVERAVDRDRPRVEIALTEVTP